MTLKRTAAQNCAVPLVGSSRDAVRMSGPPPLRTHDRHRRAEFGALPDDLFIQDAPWPRFGRPIRHDVETWRVIDDWPARAPVTDTEIDVFEARFGDVFDELFGPARCGKEIADMTVPLRAAHSHLDWRSGVIVATAAPLVLAIAFIAMR